MSGVFSGQGHPFQYEVPYVILSWFDQRIMVFSHQVFVTYHLLFRVHPYLINEIKA